MEAENNWFYHRSCKELAGNSSRKLLFSEFHRSLPILVKLSEGKVSQVKEWISDTGKKERPGQYPRI